jgi:hypothetical protein
LTEQCQHPEDSEKILIAGHWCEQDSLDNFLPGSQLAVLDCGHVGVLSTYARALMFHTQDIKTSCAPCAEAFGPADGHSTVPGVAEAIEKTRGPADRAEFEDYIKDLQARIDLGPRKDPE